MLAKVLLASALLIAATVSLRSRFASAAEEPRPDSHLYGGVTLAQWRARIVDFDASSPAAARAVAPLLEILADEQVDDVTRSNAAIALGNIRGPAQSATPQLIRMTLAGDKASPWAAKALSLMGPAAREATPQLAQIATDGQQPLELRQLSLEALGLIAGAHPDAVPTLIAMTSSDEPALRTLAIEALGVAGRDAAVAAPILIRLIRNPRENDEVRRQSAIALGKFGDQAAVAVVPLTETLVFDESEAVRDAAATSLATLGPTGQTMLIRFLKQDDAGVRWRAAMALGNVKDADEQVRVALTTALRDADVHVQLRAVQSLVKLNADAAQTIPVIVRLMQSEVRTTRIDAVELLVSMGESAHQAMPQLEQLARSQQYHIRRTAELAIKRLTAPEVP